MPAEGPEGHPNPLSRLEPGHPGLYIHVPFCARICPYCDFSVATGNRDKQRRFAESLGREMATRDDFSWCFDTVYLGGGTPSALSPDELCSILEGVRRRSRLADETFFFLEVNPEDVTPSALAEWRDMGFRALSLGVQSFQDDALSFLGRRHDSRQAVRSVEQALSGNFHTVSADLIYGLPWQTEPHWRRDLAQAAALGLDHLSCYQLTFHAGTPFGERLSNGELKELSNDEQGDLFLTTHLFLQDQGYAGYEVSNFATHKRHHSRHNMKYWNHTPYLGLGPSAHSFDGRRRFWNVRSLSDWQERISSGRSPKEDEESLTNAELALESLMLGLRTYAGIDLPTFQEAFRIPLLQINRPLIETLEASGLLVFDEARLRPTLRGLSVADRLAASFQLESKG